ncbi:putative cyclin-dependent kinase inhibitor [Medicago truncatula]|uniref:Putative cyclin-dependent kinase inhibitor n=1 Tax=Medicago truncatula TaxID=3880 RepID=A0A396GRY0_MEDTR|nr:cyclin-dependent kinase inhibitor 7-like [Medicago truncatula]RHN42264.1 putative cyclin-dependent kinase inhibitor [Medicago truncatula]
MNENGVGKRPRTQDDRLSYEPQPTKRVMTTYRDIIRMLFMKPSAVEEQCSSTVTSDESSTSFYSSNNNLNLNRITDGEVDSAAAAQAGTSRHCGDQTIRRREMGLTRAEEEEEVDSHSMEKKKKKPQNMPEESELDEFFSAAEKDIQKQFQNKYNYDIVKDMPLEGPYEWVQLKL